MNVHSHWKVNIRNFREVSAIDGKFAPNVLILSQTKNCESNSQISKGTNISEVAKYIIKI